MVLEQKPFSVQNPKCLEIQTNADDIEDNKLCLETLKARQTLRYYGQATITVATDGNSTGIALANGLDSTGTGVNAGSAIAPGTSWITGFQRYGVTLTTPGVAETGLATDRVMVETQSATGTDTSAPSIINIKALTEEQSDGTYNITGYTASFFAVAQTATNATLTITANIYVADTTA